MEREKREKKNPVSHEERGEAAPAPHLPRLHFAPSRPPAALPQDGGRSPSLNMAATPPPADPGAGGSGSAARARPCGGGAGGGGGGAGPRGRCQVTAGLGPGLGLGLGRAEAAACGRPGGQRRAAG